MLLTTRYLYHAHSRACPLLLLHGLFGSLDNLATLASAFSATRSVILADLRNHGQSPHAATISYPLMAQDVFATLDHLGIGRVSVVGHSMGGKVAMAMTELAPERIEQMVVLDIAPIAYATCAHRQAIFTAIAAVEHAAVATRAAATTVMRRILTDETTTAFLLKSFRAGKWVFHWRALAQHAAIIDGWQPVAAWPHPCLFVRGENSDYLQPHYRQVVLDQFPQARVHSIAQAGHWVHADKPQSVVRAMQRYLTLTQ